MDSDNRVSALARIGMAEQAFAEFEPDGLGGDGAFAAADVKVWCLDAGGECIGEPVECGRFSVEPLSPTSAMVVDAHGAGVGRVDDGPAHGDGFEQGLGACALAAFVGIDRAGGPVEMREVAYAARTQAEESWAGASPLDRCVSAPFERNVLLSSAWLDGPPLDLALRRLEKALGGKAPLAWRSGGKAQVADGLAAAVGLLRRPGEGLVVCDRAGALDVSCGGRGCEVRSVPAGITDPEEAWAASARLHAAERLGLAGRRREGPEVSLGEAMEALPALRDVDGRGRY